MNYIITESQMKTALKLDRSTVNPGKLGKFIKEIVLMNIIGRNICDFVVHYANDKYYIIMLVQNTSVFTSRFKDNLENKVNNFIGVRPYVVISESEDCEFMVFDNNGR
jgi:hypothetical protein